MTGIDIYSNGVIYIKRESNNLLIHYLSFLVHLFVTLIKCTVVFIILLLIFGRMIFELWSM